MTSTFSSTTSIHRPRSAAPGKMSLPEGVILLMIALMPLWATAPMNAPMLDISPLRLVNIIPVLCLGAFFLLPRPDGEKKFEARARTVFWSYIIFFAVAFLRSVPNLEKFKAVDPTFVDTTTLSYIDTSLVLRTLSAMTFLYALRAIRDVDSLRRWLYAIAASVFPLSCVVLLGIAQDTSILTSFNRHGLAEFASDVLGMHYNNAGTFYVVTGPLVIYLAARGHWFWILNAVLAFVAVVLLESRTSLYIFVAMGGVTLVMLGRASILAIAVPALLIVAVVAFGPLLADLLSIGFREQGGAFSANSLLMGRQDEIWAPLLAEWWADPVRFWFGAGQQGILTSSNRAIGAILTVSQAHNAALELFLDCGLIMAVLFMGVLLAFCLRGRRLGLRLNSQLYWVLFFCWLSFLIASLTGRRFFPEPENMLLFPVLGALVALVGLHARGALPARGHKSPAADRRMRLRGRAGAATS